MQGKEILGVLNRSGTGHAIKKMQCYIFIALCFYGISLPFLHKAFIIKGFYGMSKDRIKKQAWFKISSQSSPLCGTSV